MYSMFSKFTAFACLVVLVIEISSCAFLNRNKPGGAEYRELIKIPIVDKDQRTAAFNDYPVEKQVEIYLYAMVYCYPSQWDFQEYLTTNGESKLSKLAEAIETKDSLVAKSHLIGAIFEIDRQCSCVANDSSLMERLKRNEGVVNAEDNENDGGWKRNYNQTLLELQRRGSGPNDRQIQNESKP